MPVGPHHNLRDLDNIVVRYVILKKVAHRIYKNEAGTFPDCGLFQLLRNQARIKTHFVRMPWYTPKTLSKSLRIAVCATRANFGTASDGIPSCVRPFN